MSRAPDSAEELADRPEPDRMGEAPHPRMTGTLFGHAEAEATFLQAVATGRLHHAWLLSGPRGVGKATLAWRMARHLVAMPAAGGGLFGAPEVPGTLDMAPDHPVWRRTAALAEGGIALCRRGWDDKAKRLKTQLTVDEVRRLKAQFALSAPDGGWRAAIVDAADEMNTAAANAILKLLEEPPERTVLILVSHQPARLLPTIRSRCRTLRLGPLGPEDLGRALAQAGCPLDRLELLHALGGGSVGEAVALIDGEGAEIYPEILARLAEVPRMDRAAVGRLAARAAGRTNQAAYEMLLRLTLLAVARLARAGAGGPGDLLELEVEAARRLVPGPGPARALAETHGALGARAAHARAVNLDPEQVILDMFLAIETAAARATA